MTDRRICAAPACFKPIEPGSRYCSGACRVAARFGFIATTLLLVSTVFTWAYSVASWGTIVVLVLALFGWLAWPWLLWTALLAVLAWGASALIYRLAIKCRVRSGGQV